MGNNIQCKGSIALGNACMKCDKCKKELKVLMLKMQKLKWNKWIGVSNIPINKTLVVEIETAKEDKDDYRTAVFTEKNGVIRGKINGAFWVDQKILRWADLEVVL